MYSYKNPSNNFVDLENIVLGTKNSEIVPHLYVQLISAKGTKEIQSARMEFSISTGAIRPPYAKQETKQNQKK